MSPRRLALSEKGKSNEKEISQCSVSWQTSSRSFGSGAVGSIVWLDGSFLIASERGRSASSGQPSAVRASRPTARPAHASPHLIDADLDAAFPGGFLLCRSDPTNPLVSRQR